MMKIQKTFLILYSAIILFLSYFIIFRNYHFPEKRIGDEKYTIASAFGYIYEPYHLHQFHPPLGPVLIAAGEILINPNENIDTRDLGSRNQIEDFPQGFSFRGVRFFPVLMGFLCPLLFFILLYLTVRHVHYAALFSCLYLFDNALIVQSRSANLDSIQIFFMLITLITFTSIISAKRSSWINYVLMGIAAGAAIMVRVNSAILIPLFPIAGFIQIKKGIELKKVLIRATVAFSAIAVFTGVFIYIDRAYHNSLDLNSAEAEHADIEYSRKIISITPSHIKRNLLIMPVEDTYSSHPASWPVGRRSITYIGTFTPETGQYVYFQGNPAAWLAGLIAIILSLALLISRYVFGLIPSSGKIFRRILVYVSLYLMYMGVFLSLNRALYLTHYLIPLIFSFILAYLLFFYCFGELIKKKDRMILWAAIFYSVQVIAVFLFFSPLTYYREISFRDFRRRAWVEAWDLTYGLRE